MTKSLLFRVTLLSICLLASINAGHAQQINKRLDSIVKSIAYYGIQNPNQALFAHLDKTIYVNNEDIWFTAYLLDGPSGETARHKVLSALLVSDSERKLTTEKKFVMLNGLAFGSLTIPDTIPPGSYTFLAYTNVVKHGKPQVLFKQSITVKSATAPSFNVALELDTLVKDETFYHVKFRVDASEVPVKAAVINYSLGANPKSGLSGKAKTDAIGRYELLVAKSSVSAGHQDLSVRVTNDKQVKSLVFTLPLQKTADELRFYPEGGYLIAGVPNRVGIEARTAAGDPLFTNGLLYANDKLIDTVSTDKFGLGMFYIDAAPNTTYKIKLLHAGSPVFILPPLQPKGIGLQVRNALVKDTLNLLLVSSQPQTAHLLVHNYNEVTLALTVKLIGNGTNLKIDLTNVPRGLQSVTLLDSLYRPCAERLFFAHYDQKPKLTIQVTRPEYAVRQKVTFNLKVTGKSGLPERGVFSIACVENNRLDTKQDNNIENYTYLRGAIDNIAVKANLMGNDAADRNYLNKLLLIRGWSRYKWLDASHATMTDTTAQQDTLNFKTNVTYYDKPLKKPALLVMLKEAKVSTIPTDSRGFLTFTDDDLTLAEGKRLALVISGKSDAYAIDLKDPYLPINKSLANSYEAGAKPIVQALDTRQFLLKGMEHATHLREVKIIASNNGRLYGKPGANACGDYVCKYNILNCINHPNDNDNTQPIEGHLYSLPGRGRIMYTGCALPEKGMVMVKGIYESKEFYGADYSQFSPTEPDYISTLFWKHALKVDATGSAQASFYTGDITGKFKIVVQGVTSTDVAYGEQTFIVK